MASDTVAELEYISLGSVDESVWYLGEQDADRLRELGLIFDVRDISSKFSRELVPIGAPMEFEALELMFENWQAYGDHKLLVAACYRLGIKLYKDSYMTRRVV